MPSSLPASKIASCPIAVQLGMALSATGVTEVVDVEQISPTGVFHSLTVLSRLMPGMKEEDWVNSVVVPLRALARKRDWSIRTGKEYIDKELPNGDTKVVFGFLVSVYTDSHEELIQEVQKALLRALPNPKRTAAPTRLPARKDTSRAAVARANASAEMNIHQSTAPNATYKITILNSPIKEIERPLGPENTIPMDREQPKVLPSEYPHLTGSYTRPGAGAVSKPWGGNA